MALLLLVKQKYSFLAKMIGNERQGSCVLWIESPKKNKGKDKDKERRMLLLTVNFVVLVLLSLVLMGRTRLAKAHGGTGK